MTVRAPGARSCQACLVLTVLLAVAVPSRASEPLIRVQSRRHSATTVAGQAPTALPRGLSSRPPLQSADPASGAARPRPWWGWLLLGRLHSIVVHFPIALLTAAAIVDAWRAARRRPVPSEAGTYCLAFGVAGAVVSVGLGTLNAGHQAMTGDAAAALERHQVMGWISTMAAMTALGAGQVARRVGQFRAMAVYVGLLLATGAAVGATGHLGGGLVYGEDYLTGTLPWNQSAKPVARIGVPVATTGSPAMASMGLAVAPVTPAAARPPVPPAPPAAAGADGQAEAVDFTRDVMPILKRNCVECHGPDKVKARLRMDSVEALQKGGKSGALLKAGDPENSLIMRRVLGLDDEDQMPLDKDPLTEKQIDTLRRWIAAGAHYPAAGSQ